MTNSWNDIKNTDLVLIMGGNAAEAHPCGFKWVTEAKANNGAKLIVVDPRFTRSAAVADVYAPIRPGTDIAFLSGVMRYLLANNKILTEYVKAYTNASYIVKEGFAFNDGLFTGYDEARKNYVDRSSWEYEFDEQGMAKVDDTLQNPRCAINLLKAHVERYTPEMVERITGTPKAKFLQICEMIGSTATGDRTMTSMYALGWTQRTTGAQNIRSMAMIQLLLGNMGMPGGGVNALRGHSNVQGITDLALLSTSTPGYLVLPTDREATYDDYMKSRRFKPLRPGQTSFWQNYEKFSFGWYFYIHISIPLIIYLRVKTGFGWHIIPFTIGAAVGGQIVGGIIKKRRNGARLPGPTSSRRPPRPSRRGCGAPCCSGTTCRSRPRWRRCCSATARRRRRCRHRRCCSPRRAAGENPGAAFRHPGEEPRRCARPAGGHS